MEEIKVWAIGDPSEVVSLQPKDQMVTESLLEETLVKNPELLIPDLRLVGRQISTPTGSTPDLLGVDKNGKLVVFELKRGELARDAVAQIIDYASELESMHIGALSKLISDGSGKGGIEEIEDFLEWYDQNFQELEELRPLRMCLVGLGVDDTTERMVTFLAKNSNMDISLITFHGFEYAGKMLLAKSVRVEGTAGPDTLPARRYPSTAERKERLEQRIEALCITELFADARSLFKGNWRECREYVGQSAVGFHLPEHTEPGIRMASYARIGTEPGKIRIIFYGRTIDLCREKFEQAEQAIPSETDRSPNPTKGTQPELIFPLDTTGWDAHKERLTELVQTVYQAWQMEMDHLPQTG